MKGLKIQIAVTMALAALTFVAGLFCHLALTDIYHGEADTSLEWRVVQCYGLIVLAFIGLTMSTLARVWKVLP